MQREAEAETKGNTQTTSLRLLLNHPEFRILISVQLGLLATMLLIQLLRSWLMHFFYWVGNPTVCMQPLVIVSS